MFKFLKYLFSSYKNSQKISNEQNVIIYIHNNHIMSYSTISPSRDKRQNFNG